MVLQTETTRKDRGADAQAPRRILLVYPRIPSGTYWSFDTALRFMGKKSMLPPLGLVTVAAMLPETCELRLVDENVRALRDEEIAWADAVFVSMMIVQAESGQSVLDRARALGVPTVAGGPHPSSNYADVRADHYVLGEVEGLLGRFWEDFAAGRARRVYARPLEEATVGALRAYFGEEADIALREERPCLEEAPVPRFDLLEVKAYRSMAVQASRGCPIGCEFCDIWRRYGRTPRYKPDTRLLAELDALRAAGHRGPVFIVDDNFIGNKRKVKALLRSLLEWQTRHGHPFEFYTEATLTLADDPELMELMYATGFDFVFVGIETPSAESLAETGKQINSRRAINERVAEIQRHGLTVMSGFIIGFDNDPPDIADKMVECIQDCGIPAAMVGLLQALPETNLYDRLEREGRLLDISNGNNTHEFTTNFRPRRPMQALAADYAQVLRAVYPPDLAAYFDRARVLRENARGTKPARRRLGWTEVRTFFSYLGALPFQRYRWQALRFLLGTLRHKPGFFAQAMGVCVQGHHFANITQKAFVVARVDRCFHERLAALGQILRQNRDLASRNAQEVLQYIRLTRTDLERAVGRAARQFGVDARRVVAARWGELRRMAEAVVHLEQFFATHLHEFQQQAAAQHTGHAAWGRLAVRKDEILAEAARRAGEAHRGARDLVEQRFHEFQQEIESLWQQYTGSQSDRGGISGV